MRKVRKQCATTTYFPNEINAVDSMSDTVDALDDVDGAPPGGVGTLVRPLPAVRAQVQKRHQRRVEKFARKIELDPLSCPF
jgi:hypothetical protein